MTRTEPSPPPSLARTRPRTGLPLGAITVLACLAQFMVVLDSTIVTVALPQMRVALHMSAGQQQWVVDAYLIPLGGLLLLAARTGDVVGHKRMFQIGLAVFTVASLVGGLAGGPDLLLTARAVQGIGAAALAPASLSLLTSSHLEAQRRTRALAAWTIAGGAAGSVGVVLGGVLTAELNWRWVMFVNVPIGVAVFLIAARLPASARRADRPQLDIPGGLTATLAAGALTYGLTQANGAGWSSARVMTSLFAAAVFAALFVGIELRSRQPVVPFALLRFRRLPIGNAIMLCLGATMTAALYFITLYLQQTLHYSALRSGLALLPITIVIVAGGIASRRLVPVLGPRRLVPIGGVICTAGLIWMSRLPDHPAYVTHVLGPTLVTGAGLSLMLLSVTVAATTGVEPRNAGAASGLLNTSRQLGGAIGLAVLGTVSASAARAHGGSAVHGYQAAFLADAGLTLLATGLALLLPAD